MQFKDIPGGEKMKERLCRSIHENRVHHTQLFLGNPGGIGLTMARAFAQMVNCENPLPNDSCGECNSCLKAKKLLHPDIHYTYPTITKKSGEKPIATDFITEWRATLPNHPFLEYLDWMKALGAETKQGNITARECQEINRTFSLKSVEGKYRIQIIWMSELLSKEGNRLLKLLEEPPANSLFILVASEEEAILNTILSRCQVSRIPVIEDETIINYLQFEKGLDNDAARRLVVLTDGNINQALYLADHPEASSNSLFKEWFGVISRDPKGLPKLTDRLSKLGKGEVKNLMMQGSYLCRESLILQTSDLPGRLPEEDHKIAAWLAKRLEINAINHLSKSFEETIYHVERNGNVKLQLMSLSLKIQEVLAG